MKKAIAVIILALVIGNSFGQIKLEGPFYSHDTYNWYGFTFNADNTFTHSTWSCNGGGISKGTYSINGETLTLNYNTIDTLKSFSSDKIICPPSDGKHFNKYQFTFKKDQEEIYRIKKCKSDKIVLTQGKYDFHFWSNKEIKVN